MPYVLRKKHSAVSSQPKLAGTSDILKLKQPFAPFFIIIVITVVIIVVNHQIC